MKKKEKQAETVEVVTEEDADDEEEEIENYVTAVEGSGSSLQHLQ